MSLLPTAAPLILRVLSQLISGKKTHLIHHTSSGLQLPKLPQCCQLKGPCRWQTHSCPQGRYIFRPSRAALVPISQAQRHEVMCLHKNQRILQEITGCHILFALLLSSKRYKGICCCSTRLQSSFPPQALILFSCSTALQNRQFSFAAWKENIIRLPLPPCVAEI